jgi:hypothetical protein
MPIRRASGKDRSPSWTQVLRVLQQQYAFKRMTLPQVLWKRVNSFIAHTSGAIDVLEINYSKMYAIASFSCYL